MNIINFDTVESTNDTAKMMALENCPEWTVVHALTQTKGKGRLGRSWFSPAGDGLFFSVVLRPVRIDNLPAATLVAALAVYRALRKMNITAGIKWPNDILFNGKKICGILLESVIQENSVKYLVIGIGLNLNGKKFHDELAARATSLFLETGRKFEQDSMLGLILEELLNVWHFFIEKGFLPLISEYKSACVHMNRKVLLIQGDKTRACICVDISEGGELAVRFEDGEIKKMNAGEVSLRGMDYENW